MFDRGIITINEFRELLYYEPIEGGDVRMISLNYVKTDDQSLYQVGQDSNQDQEQDPGQQARIKSLEAGFYFAKTRKKGGSGQNAKIEENL